MTDDRFDELMRDAAQTYRKPPTAQLDEMWKQIETASFRNEKSQNINEARGRRLRLAIPRWVGIAATLVIGVGIGRYSTSLGRNHTPATNLTPAAVAAMASANAEARADSAAVAPYEAETSKYLGQTAALLIALPTEARGGRADEQFAARANELLNRTRLLMDSPAATDPQMQSLLEDLELVLAQIVRLQNDPSRTDLDLINRALEQRDVIPRLRTAVADISAN
jgi:hypothetical protein